MDQQGWNLVNAGIACVSAIAAGVAAWASILVYRRQVDPGQPTISAHFDSETSLMVSIENTGGVEWTVTELVLPSKARGQLSDLLVEYDGYGGVTAIEPAKAEMMLVEGAIPINRRLHARGTSVEWGGRGDKAWIGFHISSPRKRLSMRLILVSHDARQRRIVIPIKRTLPDNSSTPTD